MIEVQTHPDTCRLGTGNIGRKFNQSFRISNSRKWNSKQLNVGVLSETFWLPEFPKVGFWTIRVQAQGQNQEKKVKVEKYYRPKFEVFVRMPTFIFDTDQVIKAEVSSAYLFEKKAKGTIQVRWYAKKVNIDF